MKKTSKPVINKEQKKVILYSRSFKYMEQVMTYE